MDRDVTVNGTQNAQGDAEMDHFSYRAGTLHCDGVALPAIADAVGTPAYVYSKDALLDSFAAYDRAFESVPHVVCYAIKANSNLGVLATLARAGAGADIVSGGELYRALRAGIPAHRVIFAGVGKTREEMAEALKAEILLFNVESASELRTLNEVAQAMGTRAPIALRVNPDVDPQTHPYISTGLRSAKFGIPIADAVVAYEDAARMPGLAVIGAQMHIGSQLLKTSPWADSIERLAGLVEKLRAKGIEIRIVDVGGGLGIRYTDEMVPSHQEYARVLLPALRQLNVTVLLEPGRSIVGNAGVLLTRVLYRKNNADKKFVIVDAAMNDLIRPALYGAHHEIRSVREVRGAAETVDVVGPICESGDFLAKDRALPPVEENELLAIMSAGAYGFSQASNYNSRPRAVEVLVDGSAYTVVRRRESYDDLVAGESLP
jgi:diaminopimelate decarboxylase